MGLLDTVINSLRFKDTIIYKETSDLQAKHDALCQLNEEYPNNSELLNELKIVKKGLDGENEIVYQLKKVNIGMYVLRDIKVQYEDLTAQIDYIVITPVYIYYIECKNLIGNITVNEKGDFIREYTFNGKKVKKGMYSPLRQVEAQREVIRKIWESNTSKIQKVFASNHFDYYRRVLVVAANQETILNTTKAPKDIKYKILRADGLVKQIQYDLSHLSNNEPFSSQKEMEQIAQSYLSLNCNKEIDFYNFYKEKYCFDVDTSFNDEQLKERLIDLRKQISKEMSIPAYYVFTNSELDKLISLKPKTIDELEKANILPAVKIKTHGNKIIDEFNN